MVDPIEVPDNLSKTQLPDKLKPVVRSDPEKDREGFSRALKEKMEEELEEKKKQKKDLLEIGPDAHQENQNDKQYGPEDDSDETIDKEDKIEPGESDHIDLKA